VRETHDDGAACARRRSRALRHSAIEPATSREISSRAETPNPSHLHPHSLPFFSGNPHAFLHDVSPWEWAANLFWWTVTAWGESRLPSAQAHEDTRRSESVPAFSRDGTYGSPEMKCSRDAHRRRHTGFQQPPIPRSGTRDASCHANMEAANGCPPLTPPARASNRSWQG
jgi:hypothetical protein